MNPIFKYENDYHIVIFSFATVLYIEYSKLLSQATVHFYEPENTLQFEIDDSDFMNLITGWKNWKTEEANTPPQQIFL